MAAGKLDAVLWKGGTGAQREGKRLPCGDDRLDLPACGSSSVSTQGASGAKEMLTWKANVDTGSSGTLSLLQSSMSSSARLCSSTRGKRAASSGEVERNRPSTRVSVGTTVCGSAKRTSGWRALKRTNQVHLDLALKGEAEGGPFVFLRNVLPPLAALAEQAQAEAVL